jgi:hypothetical protein
MESKLPFGLRNGHPIHISQVEKGLKCGCSCPVCRQILIARKGTKTIHHFAHYRALECLGAFESAIHMAAKEILESYGKILLPAVMTSLGNNDGARICLYKQQMLKFKKMSLERRIDRIIPDILLEVNGRKLIIEITVTHGIDVEKLNRIKKLNISTLEIDLTNLAQNLSLTELERVVVYGPEHKRWIYNSKKEEFRNEIKSYGKPLKLYYRNVYNCPSLLDYPSGKKHVDLIEKCLCCDYLIHMNGDNSNSQKHILCLGHAKNEINQIINRYNAKI